MTDTPTGNEHAEWVLRERRRLNLPPWLAGGEKPRGKVSASKLKRFEECPLSYKMQYLDKTWAPEDGEHRALGTVVHAALETVGRERVLGNVSPVEPVSNKELVTALERAVAAKRVEAASFRRAIELLKDVRKHLNFSATVALEEPFTWKFGDAETDVAVGVIDRIDVVGEWVEVWDYKSGAKLPTTVDFESDPQVLLYLAWAHRKFGTDKVRAKFWYLASGGLPLTLEWTKERDEQALAHLRTFVKAISEGGQGWVPRTGGHCVRCDHRAECPAYARLARSDAATPEAAFEGGGVAALLREHERLKALEKVATEQREQVREAIEDLIAQQGGGALIADGLRARMIAPARTKRPQLPHAVSLVCQALAKHGIVEKADDVLAEVADLEYDKKRMAAFLSRYRADVAADAEKALDEASSKHNSFSYVDVRQIGGPF